MINNNNYYSILRQGFYALFCLLHNSNKITCMTILLPKSLNRSIIKNYEGVFKFYALKKHVSYLYVQLIFPLKSVISRIIVRFEAEYNNINKLQLIERLCNVYYHAFNYGFRIHLFLSICNYLLLKMFLALSKIA